jgi:DNA repair exonuclease SbcCD ATPase subunit
VKLDTEKKMEILCSEAQRLDGQLQSTEHFTAALAAYQSAIRLREALMNAKDRSVQHLQRMEAETCPFQITNKESDRLKSEQASLLLQTKELLQKQETIAAISSWVGPRGIQTYALDFVVNKLAVLMTNWLQKLFGNNEISMTAYFDESERLVRQIKSSINNGVLSGGQYQRCQLACFLAFKELYPNNFPFICLDEAVASLDIVGIKAVQDVFKEWCSENENRTCLFISHDSTQFTETSCYQNTVKISHKRGRSSIECTDTSKKRKLK